MFKKLNLILDNVIKLKITFSIKVFCYININYLLSYYDLPNWMGSLSGYIYFFYSYGRLGKKW